MKEVKLIVRPFRMDTEKTAALKPLEEAAEVYGAWQLLGETIFGDFARLAQANDLNIRARNLQENLAYEIADCIQVCVNLADRYGIDLPAEMAHCEQRNRDRGRYKDE